MAEIVHYEPGRLEPHDPDTQPASTGVTKVEVTVTPHPQTKAQRLANDKATGLTAAEARQEQNAYQRRALSKGQEKARRKRERDIHYKAIQAALASGAISAEQAKNMLPKRQQSTKASE